MEIAKSDNLKHSQDDSWDEDEGETVFQEYKDDDKKNLEMQEINLRQVEKRIKFSDPQRGKQSLLLPEQEVKQMGK